MPAALHPGRLRAGMIPDSWSGLTTVFSLRVESNAGLCGQLPQGLQPDAVEHGGSTQLSQQCYWQPDAQLLLDFKAGLQDPDGELGSWQPNSNPCGFSPWSGLLCEEGWVVALRLQDTRVAGPLSAQLAFVSRLWGIRLASNGLVGERAAGSWGRAGAIMIWVGWPWFGGIPPCHPAAPASHMQGTLPAEWRFQSNLNVVDLSGNSFTGTLPPVWGELKQLRLLDLSANQLAGGASCCSLPGAASGGKDWGKEGASPARSRQRKQFDEWR
jgi:hypothetical protein